MYGGAFDLFGVQGHFGVILKLACNSETAGHRANWELWVIVKYIHCMGYL